MREAKAKLAVSDVRKLREVRRAITFERACFDNIVPSSDDPLPKSEKEVTEFIRRRTSLYIGSWILPVLDEMIARGERGAK